MHPNLQTIREKEEPNFSFSEPPPSFPRIKLPSKYIPHINYIRVELLSIHNSSRNNRHSHPPLTMDLIFKAIKFAQSENQWFKSSKILPLSAVVEMFFQAFSNIEKIIYPRITLSQLELFITNVKNQSGNKNRLIKEIAIQAFERCFFTVFNIRNYSYSEDESEIFSAVRTLLITTKANKMRNETLLYIEQLFYYHHLLWHERLFEIYRKNNNAMFNTRMEKILVDLKVDRYKMNIILDTLQALLKKVEGLSCRSSTNKFCRA
jgi:hypothetical protein